jgi:hypothetical protein
MNEGKGKRSWLKAGLGTVAGLLSGAALMYLTPLVDKVIKPAPPLANFEARAEGLTVTLHNLSGTGAGLEGWWDFGDGSPLVPLADQDVSHSYQRPGDYTVRLSVRNLLGESNERSVPVHLESGSPEPPRILSLDALPLMPQAQAPATFRVASEVKNAQLTVWDLDESRPFEVLPAAAGRQERLVTFEKPGNYVIKLAAFNGQQNEQKSVAVAVRPAPAGSLTVELDVTDQVVQVERKDRSCQVIERFPASAKGLIHRFEHKLSATPGWSICDACLEQGKKPGPGMQGQARMVLDPGSLGLSSVRNLVLERDADGKTARLSGELIRDSDSRRPPPTLSMWLVLREERRRPVARNPIPVLAALPVPGSTQLQLPPLSSGWELKDRRLRMELREGNRSLWQATQLPGNIPVTIRGRRLVLSAIQSGDRIQVNLADAAAR